MELKKYQLEPEVRKVNIINEQDKIFLTIKIGNGQIGGSKVTLGEKIISKGNLSQPALLGNSSELIGKEIKIITNVLDVNNFTNMCVFTTTFLNQDNKVLFSKIDYGEAPESGIASFLGKYKLFIISLFFIALNLLSFTSIAQLTSNDISFQNLETPSSPGFILLDKTPSSIERPTTPTGFGVSFLGLFQETGGAMEFTPFWITNHPKLTADSVYKSKFPILYNFSISTATIKSDTSSFLAGGFRTRLLQIHDKKTIEKLDSLKKAIEFELSNINPDNPDFSKLETLKKEYSDLFEKKMIFTVDIAGAIGGGSETNSFNDISLNRWSVWLSFNWCPNGNNFYITAVTRYINNEKFENYNINADLFDIGARLNYDISKFCLSVEYIQRLNITNSGLSDYRIAAIGSYQLSDNFYFTTTFGKNFSEVNNIIALAGISFGVSKSKIKAY